MNKNILHSKIMHGTVEVLEKLATLSHINSFECSINVSFHRLPDF